MAISSGNSQQIRNKLDLRAGNILKLFTTDISNKKMIFLEGELINDNLVLSAGNGSIVNNDFGIILSNVDNEYENLNVITIETPDITIRSLKIISTDNLHNVFYIGNKQDTSHESYNDLTYNDLLPYKEYSNGTNIENIRIDISGANSYTKTFDYPYNFIIRDILYIHSRPLNNSNTTLDTRVRISILLESSMFPQVEKNKFILTEQQLINVSNNIVQYTDL